jgi:poly(hydroxyalkanoate) depolymerase family esterase
MGIQGLFAQLTEVTGFGANPGNLKMYTHIPTGMSINRPLVLVLHGCGQSAQSFADESGWNLLADTYEFALLYPEQKTINNISTCFNWFSSGDIERNQGESASIKNMMVSMVSSYNIDTSRIFITGFSAGACMSAVMMACYPDVFKKGAIMAGTPYKSADGLFNPLLAMNPGINQTPSTWGDLVRDAYTELQRPIP